DYNKDEARDRHAQLLDIEGGQYGLSFRGLSVLAASIPASHPKMALIHYHIFVKSFFILCYTHGRSGDRTMAP
ncbi:MAG: hypothetical protein OEU26_36410, partial [Candidatus Tectomicrobia bacterium]|nr:hypothetical protein [Candidatus Tectomicrobia bacterium]